FHCRVGLHIVLFEVCSAFTHVAACTLARSPYFVTAIRGLQTFRHLHACPGCFRRERSPGGPCTHWKSAALSRRTWRAAPSPADNCISPRIAGCTRGIREAGRADHQPAGHEDIHWFCPLGTIFRLMQARRKRIRAHATSRQQPTRRPTPLTL